MATPGLRLVRRIAHFDLDTFFVSVERVRDPSLAGPRIGEELGRLGVRTIGDLARLDRTWLERRFGRAGAVLAERARGLDPEPVRAGGREARSISREVTFAQDVTSRDELVRTLRRHAERVGEDLRRQQRRARTVTLKLRWPDFSTPTRSRTVERPLQGTEELAAVGVALLDELVASEGMRPVRLIGLGATNLVEDAVQLALGDEGARRDERLDEAIDGIRDRHGPSAVVRGL